MLPSAIQLQHMAYLGIKVLPRQDAIPIGDTPFDFNGVMIGEGIEVAPVEDESANPDVFAIKLRIQIENKEGKICPYDIDVEAAGYFVIDDKIPAEQREELVSVNGCAVLYGCIRDQVLTLTSRCSNGALMMPTVNFLDRRKKPAEKKPQDA